MKKLKLCRLVFVFFVISAISVAGLNSMAQAAPKKAEPGDKQPTASKDNQLSVAEIKKLAPATIRGLSATQLSGQGGNYQGKEYTQAQSDALKETRAKFKMQ